MAISNAEMLALARKLPIPVPWNRDVFIENLARQRDRPIRLIPTDTSAFTENPCGLWLIRDDDDLIFHQAGTSDYHIDQIVCHEIGHMVLGHAGGQQADTNSTPNVAMLRKLLPDIDPTTVQSVLGRTVFVDDQERGAEMFANMLMIAAIEAGEQTSMMRNAFFHRA